MGRTVPRCLQFDAFALAGMDVDDEDGNCTVCPYGTTDVFDRYPQSLLQGAVFCFVVFVVVGVPGNAITALALSRSKTVRNATAAFVVNLSVADLLFCLINIPLAISNFVHRGWVHGESLCVLSAFLRYGNVGVSLLTVTAITLNRYATIVHSDRFHPRLHFQPATIWVMVTAIWLASFGPLLPTLMGVWGKFGFDTKVGTCSIVAGADGRSPKAVLFVVAFALPCVIICLCYMRIFCVVRRSRRRACKTTHKRVRSPTTDQDVVAVDQSHPHPGGTDLRLVKMILVIFGSFVLCNLPLTLVKVFGKEEDMKVLNVIGYVALYATSCTNPIVYVAMSREYRQAYVQLFTTSSTGRHTQTSGRIEGLASGVPQNKNSHAL